MLYGCRRQFSSHESHEGRMKINRQHELWMHLIWGMAGLGVGLLLMSLLMSWWPSQDAGHASQQPAPSLIQAAQEDEELQTALAALRAGQLPQVLHASQATTGGSPWTGLWQALQQLHDDRTQALATFEAQVRQAAPGPWMQASQLITPQGRKTLEERLRILDQALNAWARRESEIQSAYDGALHAWFQQAPSWVGLDTQQAMVEAGSDAVRSLYDYVSLEQSLLTQIRHLSQHIDSLGARVKLSAPAGDDRDAAAELVFVQRADLNRYQSSVTRLSELAAQEQAQMAQIRELDKRHWLRLAEALSMRPAPALSP